MKKVGFSLVAIVVAMGIGSTWYDERQITKACDAAGKFKTNQIHTSARLYPEAYGSADPDDSYEDLFVAYIDTCVGR